MDKNISINDKITALQNALEQVKDYDEKTAKSLASRIAELQFQRDKEKFLQSVAKLDVPSGIYVIHKTPKATRLYRYNIAASERLVLELSGDALLSDIRRKPTRSAQHKTFIITSFDENKSRPFLDVAKAKAIVAEKRQFNTWKDVANAVALDVDAVQSTFGKSYNEHYALTRKFNFVAATPPDVDPSPGAAK